MFHFISAIGWLFLQPLGLAAILIAVSLVTAFFGWRRLSMMAGGLSFLVLFLSAWTTFGALLLGPLEDRFQKPDPVPERVHGIVVLGGGLEGSINSARGGHELNASGDRFVEAAKACFLVAFVHVHSGLPHGLHRSVQRDEMLAVALDGQ